MKKVLSLVLALALVCVTFAACGTETTSSTGSESQTSESVAEESSAADSSVAEESSTAEDSSTAETSDTATGETFKLGILAPATTHGWVSGVAYYAQERCKQLQEEGVLEYNLLTSNNAEEMTDQIDQLRTWGAQAVVAYPQWEGMEDPIQSLIDDGIPVVNFDIVIDAEGVYHVAGDNEGMGAACAEYIVDKIGTTGTVVMLNVPSSGSVSELRQKGFEDKIAEIAPDMNVITYATEFTREAGLSDFSDVLAANAQIDAVFSMDDETSIGVLQAIEEAGRTDIKIVTGGGGMQEYFNMMSENQDIWIQSATYSPSMIEDAVDMAVSIMNGEEVEQEVIIPTTVVDRDNVEEFLDASAPY